MGSAIKRNATHTSGFTLVEIMIVVAVIAVIAAIAIPSFVKSRADSQKKACIANLKEIDSAVQQWAIENKKTSNTSYLLTNAKLLTYLKGSRLPICPAAGVYSPGKNVASFPICSLRDTLGHSL